ncbi:hypothetical protein HN51_25395 [Ectopseudomonas mendocina]|uniref:Uncharacterized protein n=1 Tax=Ectopseudomonas mendocina S5.2 TaxID=1225174 RepID=A0ABM5W3H5_ECTME|nr:hypothetical protein DW68_024325 [Pseudomonas mendocina S5.2]KER98137.1 hypothetical protein HN51_25395 [Pseudomonas mendocina]
MHCHGGLLTRVTNSNRAAYTPTLTWPTSLVLLIGAFLRFGEGLLIRHIAWCWSLLPGLAIRLRVTGIKCHISTLLFFELPALFIQLFANLVFVHIAPTIELS